jgi:hypothetical protein
MTDLEKVKLNGYNLNFVEKQTPEICLAAYEQNKDSIKYVKDPAIKLLLSL